MIRRIDADKVRTKLHRAEHPRFAEVGSLSGFEEVRLPNAVYLHPGLDPKQAAQELGPRARDIVLYGDGPESEPEVLAMAERLEAMGYLNLYILNGGKKAWRDAGLWTEATYYPPFTPAQQKPKPLSQAPAVQHGEVRKAG